jgi:hypothetical protein
VCSNGSLTCVPDVHASIETCNNLDDDCDGLVDSVARPCFTLGSGCVLGVGCVGACRAGLETCWGGVAGACVGEVGPTPERCNGIDDDCDGGIDEDFPSLAAACDNGGMGACLATGIVRCRADGAGAYCTAPNRAPGQEVCNGEDDDCDGSIDEGALPSVGLPCGSGCGAGVVACVAGELTCGATAGSSEVCNGEDDDCDGEVDELPMPGVGERCYPYASGCTLGGGCAGECALGIQECSTAGTSVCVGAKGPRSEVCNLRDDDCDGVVDDLAACPSADQLCHEGRCALPCAATAFPCPYGFSCTSLAGGAFCLPGP